MDFLGKEQYDELLEVRGGPAISIYVEVERQDNKGKNNRLAFRDRVDRAIALLEDEYDKDDYEAVAERMKRMVDAEDFWGSLSGGVAAFFAPGFERVYRLGDKVGTETIVSDTFHTRPLLRSMLTPTRYWVLALSPKETRLYEGDADGLRPLNLVNTPTSLKEALGVAEAPVEDRNRMSTTTIGAPPAFHGYSREEDLNPRRLRKFAEQVDDGLQQMLETEKGPLILACTDKLYSVYHEVSELDNLAEEGLQASVIKWTPAEIHERTWPLARKAVESKLDDILELWEREYGFGKAETDLNQIAKRTTMNQVRYLLIEDDRHIWGELDRDMGEVTVTGENGQDPNAHTADLLDDLAEFVIARGGNAFVLPKERMPTDTGAAAILRGTGKAEYGGERARMT